MTPAHSKFPGADVQHGPCYGLADDSFGNLIEVPREPFVLHPEPRFPGETTAAGPYAFVVSIYNDAGRAVCFAGDTGR